MCAAKGLKDYFDELGAMEEVSRNDDIRALPAAGVTTAKAVHAPLACLLKSATTTRSAIARSVIAGETTFSAFTAATASVKAFKVATKVFVALDVAMTIIDASVLTYEWSTTNATVKDIDKLISTLR